VGLSVLVHRDNRLVWVNPASERLTGYSRRELLEIGLREVGVDYGQAYWLQRPAHLREFDAQYRSVAKSPHIQRLRAQYMSLPRHSERAASIAAP
jgi:PAS domain-containing protein